MEKKFERKNGTGVLFYNENVASEKHPNLSGTILTPDGKEYRIVAWKKQGKRGEYFSLALNEPKAQINSELPSNDLPF